MGGARKGLTMAEKRLMSRIRSSGVFESSLKFPKEWAKVGRHERKTAWRMMESYNKLTITFPFS